MNIEEISAALDDNGINYIVVGGDNSALDANGYLLKLLTVLKQKKSLYKLYLDYANEASTSDIEYLGNTVIKKFIQEYPKCYTELVKADEKLASSFKKNPMEEFSQILYLYFMSNTQAVPSYAVVCDMHYNAILEKAFSKYTKAKKNLDKIEYNILTHRSYDDISSIFTSERTFVMLFDAFFKFYVILSGTVRRLADVFAEK